MRGFQSIAVLLLLTACQTAREPAPAPTPEQVAQAEQDERQRLAIAGFEPLSALAARGLEVQRVDPMWGLLDYPAAELTRDAAGAVTISMKYRGHVRTAPVSADVWARFAARAPAAFAPADPRALERKYREVVRRYGYCHGWDNLEAVFGGREQRETVSVCMGDLQKVSVAYGNDLARLAIDHIPLCEPDRGKDIERALWDCGDRLGQVTPEHKKLFD